MWFLKNIFCLFSLVLIQRTNKFFSVYLLISKVRCWIQKNLLWVVNQQYLEKGDFITQKENIIKGKTVIHGQKAEIRKILIADLKSHTVHNDYSNFTSSRSVIFVHLNQLDDICTEKKLSRSSYRINRIFLMKNMLPSKFTISHPLLNRYVGVEIQFSYWRTQRQS